MTGSGVFDRIGVVGEIGEVLLMERESDFFGDTDGDAVRSTDKVCGLVMTTDLTDVAGSERWLECDSDTLVWSADETVEMVGLCT